MEKARLDHMVITVTVPEQSSRLRQALAEHRFPVTFLDAAPGDRPGAQVTLIAGMTRERLPLFFHLLRQHAGGALTRDGKNNGNGTCTAASARSRTQLSNCIDMDYVIEVCTGNVTSFIVPVQEYLQMPPVD